MPTFKVLIFHPRRSREEGYEVTFEQDKLTFAGPVMKKAVATHRENFDPEWTGTGLHRLLEDESAAPPAIFQSMIEYLWKKWREKELTDDEAKTELEHAIYWLNEVTRTKPKTDFWQKYY